MTLSRQAWLKSARVVQAIKCHPFNQELMRGSLARAKFIHYLQQDVLYLQGFARSRDYLVSRLPLRWQFILSKDTTAECEQTAVHKHFVDLQQSFSISSATISYTRHLSCVCEFEPVELGVAAMLPCYWIYRELGLCMAEQAASSDHPYRRWIQTYASDKLEWATNNMISLFNALAEQTSDATRQKMLDIFHKSMCLEWNFWNDAYHHQLEEICTCVCDAEDSATAMVSPTWSSENAAASDTLMVGSAGLEPATTPL